MNNREKKAESREKETVSIPFKLNLTIEEAAEYSNIGINRLYDLCKEPLCPFVLKVGAKTLIKRRLFEKYIENQKFI